MDYSGQQWCKELYACLVTQNDGGENTNGRHITAITAVLMQ